MSLRFKDIIVTSILPKRNRELSSVFLKKVTFFLKNLFSNSKKAAIKQPQTTV